jgi:poly(3-hydroxybutyrate) depolymerase
MRVSSYPSFVQNKGATQELIDAPIAGTSRSLNMRDTSLGHTRLFIGLLCCLCAMACASDVSENQVMDTHVEPGAGASDTGTETAETASADTGEEPDTVGPPPTNGLLLDNVLTEVDVNGATRSYRLTVPTNQPAGAMPLLIALHGGGGRDDPYPQEEQFHQLAQDEGFIVAHALAELLPGNEGEWILNTTSNTRQDIDYIEAIIDDIASSHDVDAKRVYATGYSLGSMFSYELACQLGSRFAAIASHAGTMPVTPDACDTQQKAAIMHIHGLDDEIISYDNTWDWKAWDSVGTMMDVPSLILYWKDAYNCQDLEFSDSGSARHVVYSACDQNVRVEHYRLGGVGHEWPTSISDTSTHQIIWSFLSGFSKP